MSDQRVPQAAAFMDFYHQQALPLTPFFGQPSPSPGLPAVPPNLSYPMAMAELTMPKVACAPIPLTIPSCPPPVIDLPAKLFHTLQQPPLNHVDEDCVTTCAHCHQVNTLLDLRMKKLIQRCKDEADLIHYLRKQIHFRPIPGSEYPPVPVSTAISYPHIELCKSSNFNVDADEFRPSQKNRSTKTTEMTNVNNYESAIDGYDMQSHQPVDANDLANAATESGVDSGVHDSGVSDSGILDSNTIDSISESRITDGDGASNQDSRRSTESLNDDMKSQKKKTKKKDKRKKRLDSDHTISDHSPIGDLEFVNQTRKPVLDSNQNYKPLDPKMTLCSNNSASNNGSAIVANSVDAKPTNERVAYGGGGGSSVEDEPSAPKAAGHHHHAVVHHHSSKTYSSHHHNHGGAGGPRKSPSSLGGLADKQPTNGVPERLKGGVLLQAPHSRSGRAGDGYEMRGPQPKYAQSHRGGDRSQLHERHVDRHADRHAGPKSTNGMAGVEVRKYAGHPRMRPAWSSGNDYEHQRFSTKRYENSQYNDHGAVHGGHGYSLAKGPAPVQFVSSVAVRANELEKQHMQQQQLEKCVVREVQGDLFLAPSEYSLAHCVAEDLRMSAGIAIHFRKEFGCVEELRSQGKHVGQVAFLKRGERYIYYMITKPLSQHKPKLHQMRQAIKSLRELCEQHNVTKLAMPLIGCGLDRLDWNDVRYCLECEFQDTNIDVVVYHYKEVGTPE